jgi:hypothetical protein
VLNTANWKPPTEAFGDFEITPRDLRSMLDRSGIVSRVVVVAGC